MAEGGDLAKQARDPGLAGRPAFTLPQARPLESGVEVARIAYEGLSLSFQECHEAIPCDAEQRTQQSAVGELANRRHPGEAVRAAASSAPDQKRLNLIVPVVTGQELHTGVIAAPVVKNAMASRVRRFLDSV